MTEDPVVEVAALAHIPNRLMLDVRSEQDFAESAAPDAVRVPLEEWVKLARTPEGDLAHEAVWRKKLAEIGAGPQCHAVVYDDGRMTEAARIWFILQHFGVPCSLLNGGWPALVAALRDEPVRDDARVPDTVLTCRQAGLFDRERLRRELEEVAVFDSRTRAEFEGRDLKNNARGGHLPGARLLAHGDLLANGRLKSPPELRRLIEEAGFEPGDHIVTHCDGGARAALAAVAALRAGYQDVSVYYLSFSDWAKDESCPIIRPDEAG